MLDKMIEPAQIRSMDLGQLEALAVEIREKLIDTVARNGGHLASNLGVVELTLALHAVLDTPRDKLVFDVGHQAYVHKLVTGRFDQFDTLRKQDGISGFPSSAESEYDAFTAGHASTAISAALGMARARTMRGTDEAIVAVVGDGALTGGMCYEALNDAGQSRTQLVVVLNDNEMSISHNVGALSRYLTRLRQSGPYRNFKRVVRSGLDRLPLFGKPIMHFLERTRDTLRSMFVDGQFFEALGFEYQGPIDGHDIRLLMRVLRRAKAAGRPVLVHVVTQKGKGYLPAENDPNGFHGVAPFYVENGRSIQEDMPSGGQLAAKKLCEMAETDDHIACVCAAMAQGTGLAAFQEAYPSRFFDVGIAEAHAVTMAAGLAASGYRPYVGIYSTFLQRSYDQILMDVCLPNLPVTLLIDRAGLVGADGKTHQGVFDLSYLSGMPNLAVASPRDASDLMRLLELSRRHDGPMAIRYGRDMADMGPNMRREEPLQMGEWELLAEGEDVMILAVGAMVETALNTSIELAGKGVRCGVVDARFVKPLDEALLLRAVDSTKLIVTLELNSAIGGFGAMVLQRLSALRRQKDVMVVGVPDQFIKHGTITQQIERLGLTPHALAGRIMERRSGARAE